ncbi:MAG TPA: hypothetical protein DCM05_10160 [Elusimicrobia bacterium]|nr:hypothetical protein [Elusimicrobiota bacterium]
MKNLLAALLALSFAAPAAAEEPKGAGQTPSPRAPTVTFLPDGYRGVSLPVDGHQLAFIKKGDRVDVLVTFEANMTDAKEKVTATIMQNLVVLDVVKPAKLTDPGVILLIVNPNEAQYAALAQIQGTIHIVLRAKGDTKMTPMEMAAFRKLFK